MVDDKWIYPSSKLTLEMAGLSTIAEYISKKKEQIVSMCVDLKESLKEYRKTKPSFLRCSNQLLWWKNLKNKIKK